MGKRVKITQEEEKKKVCMSDEEDEDSATGCEEDIEMDDE